MNGARAASSHAENTNTFVKQVPFLAIERDLTSLTRQALIEERYPERLQNLLLNPAREMTVELLLQLDSGEVETLKAYRVQHNNSRGPFKGGLRYHPQVDLDDVRRQHDPCDDGWHTCYACSTV